MAFGNISTFYLPTAANAGASQWGTDVRKLLDSADAGTTATSITNHGTSGTNTRTVDPYTTTTTDADQSLYGWAITPTDMNSVSGAKRAFAAGDHTLTLKLGQSSTAGITAVLNMYAYRVGDAAGGRVRTLLGSGTANAVFTLGVTEITATVAVTLDEVVFEADETIQYSWEITSTGVAITGRTHTFNTGTKTSLATSITTPGLKTLADTTGTATGTGAAAGITGKVLGTDGTSSGSGAAAGVMSARADTTGTAAGSATVAGQASSVAGSTGTAAGTTTVTGLASIVLGTTGTVSVSAAPSDYAPNDEAKAIADIVRHHETGMGVSGATVTLVRDSDGFHAATTTSEGGGAYSFARDTNDPNTYHVYVYYLDGATKIQGVSERGLVPA